MTLLAFHDPASLGAEIVGEKGSPLSSLFSIEHRVSVATQVNRAILRSQNQTQGTIIKLYLILAYLIFPFLESRLPNMLKMLVWAQNKLSSQKVAFPQILDLESCQLKTL